MDRKEELEAYQHSLVLFLKNKFCSPYKVNGKEVTRNVYAEKCDIARATLTRIKEGNGYDVPISTIYKICKFENISVNNFFAEFTEWVESDANVREEKS